MNDVLNPDDDFLQNDDNDDKFNFYIDRGGTFTDIYCEIPSRYHTSYGNKYMVMKLLSEHPSSYSNAPREGIRRILSIVTGNNKYSTDKKINSSEIGNIRMGTTVATNALLERTGESTALLITKGFADVLKIGNQSRPKIFDLNIKRPDVIYSKVYEVNERIRCAKHVYDDEIKLNNINTNKQFINDIYIEKELNLNEITNILQDIQNENIQKEEKLKIKSLAIIFMHSYAYNQHELMVKNCAEQMNYFTNITISSETISMKKFVARGHTCCADAYLTPCIKQYLSSFVKGFDDNFTNNCNIKFMQSDGGLCDMNQFLGYKSILSGPAGGVIGYINSTEIDIDNNNYCGIIGFDMGGTSTDVSVKLFNITLHHVYENIISGIFIQAPQLPILTVASGGGSVCEFSGGMMKVGPDSTGSYPGPICYKNNGEWLAITDCNLITGRIIAMFFPQIFGANRNEPLGINETRNKFIEITDTINQYNMDNNIATRLTEIEVALGFIKIANEAMCRPIRKITTSKGYSPKKHILSCFGGAGGQHCCSIARNLGIKKIFIHKFAGILSAYGMGLANITKEIQQSCAYTFTNNTMIDLQQRCLEISNNLQNILIEQGYNHENIQIIPYLNLRFKDSNNAKFIAGKSIEEIKDNDNQSTDIDDIYNHYRREFIEQYENEFGFVLKKEIIVDDIRCRGIVKQNKIQDYNIPSRPTNELFCTAHKEFNDNNTRSWFTWFDVPNIGIQRLETKVYDVNDLYANDIIKGPSLILQNTSTIVIEPNCYAKITEKGNIIIHVDTDIQSNDDNKDQKDNEDDLKKNKNKNKTVQDTNDNKDDTDNNSSQTIAVMPIKTIQDQPNNTLSKTIAVITRLIQLIDQSNYNDDNIYDDNINDIHNKTDEIEEIENQDDNVDNITLAIFSHRFMSIAELMGNALQKTSVSTNIKERLDFSCAIFGPNGDLVANAPHVPVHLGSMQHAVKYQILLLGDNIHDGDVLLSNHPVAGGTHLPDLTVMTPIFYNTIEPVFWLASRGHHSDIGGLVPGSMPPFSTSLKEEGCAIESFKLVSNDIFMEDEIRKIFKDAGSRNVDNNISDLQAQVAANQTGYRLMKNLINEYSLNVVQNYMGYIQDNAENAVKEMLIKVGKNYLQTNDDHCDNDIKTNDDDNNKQIAKLYASDYMDDGTKICVTISIDVNTGEATFDFAGTGPLVYGNINAPKSITYSAIIYCLRCLINIDIPLNEGCLKPIEIIIPPNCILNPLFDQGIDVAVVGGNVLTSQRVTDVIFRAFNACSASQGCMNNLTFGDNTGGYYETIAGGSGAGPGYNGTDGVHTHMTNTRITDPEILEDRKPVVLRKFGIRKYSGGIGRYSGGNGCERFIQFTKPLQLSILSERRSYQPYGLNGGKNGKCGKNIIKRKKDGIEINIGAKRSYNVKTGDIIKIYTPGGGGFGVGPVQD